MVASTDLLVEGATPELADEIVALFERCDAPCFCQFFQFAGDNRDWQMRCGGNREENARRLVEQLRSGALEAFVVRGGAGVIGWMRVDRPEALEKRYQGRLYRGLPCFEGHREGVFSVVCFLVDPEFRGRGVARKLLEHAVDWAQAEGHRALEAFPRGAGDVTAEEQWTGPMGLYEELGFRKVHDFAPYPVFRRDFDSPPSD